MSDMEETGVRDEPIGRRRLLALAGSAGVAAIAPRARATVAALPHAPVRLDVREFGAKADGVANDATAFQQALDRCALLGGGEVAVSAGTYLIGAIAIGARTTLRVADAATLLGSPDLADYPLRQVRWEGRFVTGRIGLIHAENVDDVAITGGGQVVGSEAIKGRVDARTGQRNPALIELVGCRRVEVSGLRTRQNAMWSLHPLFCDDVVFRDLAVAGGADGIDVDSCRRVTIERCAFDTGDDCIALKSGRGEEGWALARPTEDVQIADCTFRDAHWACIAIGSETSGGVRGVRVERCRIAGARTHAVYIKSRPGRGAFIEDVTMRDLDVTGVGEGFLRLNFTTSGKQDDRPVTGPASIPAVRRLAFSRIRVAGVPRLVDAFETDPARPVAGLTLEDITGTCGTGLRLAHVRGARLGGIAVTGYDGPLLQTRDVTGSGLRGAVPLAV